MKPCNNSSQYQICTGTVSAEIEAGLCRYCSLNEVIPDLSIEGNLILWRRLEMAKQRVLLLIDTIALPLHTEKGGDLPPLRFAFKADGLEPVSTGHDNGLITINLAEADSVERERTRVEFGEPQRTLVGHFRHELGHYYWDLLVEPLCLQEFRELFGDERNPSYADAQQAYYDRNTDADWRGQYISEYATMHPWEDFAETFGAYLDMVAIVSTARHFDRVMVSADDRNFDHMLAAYGAVGIVANELNREMGLLDLVPEVFTDPVVKKLRFIHSLRNRICNPSPSLA